jgi:hypothetical protein
MFAGDNFRLPEAFRKGIALMKNALSCRVAGSLFIKDKGG